MIICSLIELKQFNTIKLKDHNNTTQIKSL